MWTSVFFMTLFISITLTAARPQTSDSSAKILNYNSDNDGLGTYKFEYETENGIQHSEQGALQQTGKDEGGIAATGRYQYRGRNGEVVIVTYTADENGYRPKVQIGLVSGGVPGANPQLIASLVG